MGRGDVPWRPSVARLEDELTFLTVELTCTDEPPYEEGIGVCIDLRGCAVQQVWPAE